MSCGVEAMTDVSEPSDFDCRGVVVSPCGNYRYDLWRQWDAALPMLTWVVLNPPLDDGPRIGDDPTARRCAVFARNHRYGGVRVRAVFARRAANTKGLQSDADPVGPDNLKYLTRVMPGDDVAVGFGAVKHKKLYWHCVEAMCLFVPLTPLCLGVNRDGSPKHPLTVPVSTPLVEWVSEESTEGHEAS
jgi:hypothetical protein